MRLKTVNRWVANQFCLCAGTADQMHAALITKLGSLPSDTVSDLPGRECLSVFWIRDNLIRIWILRSVALDYVSGSG